MQKVVQLLRRRRFITQNALFRTCILLSFVLLSTQAKSQDFQTTKVNVDFKGISLKVALADIQKQSGIRFVFDQKFEKYAGNKISHSQNGLTVKQATEVVLKGTSLQYILVDGYVTISEKPAPQTPTSPNGHAGQGQGKGSLKGRIVEFENSDPLPGASVRIVGTNIAGSANENGYYHLTGIPSGSRILEVSFVGYQTENISVNVNADREATYDIKLQGSNALEEVTITAIGKTRAPVAHTTERQVLAEIKAAKVVVSGVSSQQISMTADRNAADVAKKISGVTVLDDKFIVIRGMNERYNLTYLNGNVAPSTELYSRAFALDLIPTRIIDKVLVYKSANPENLADATGGVVKIFTKDAKTVKHFDVEFQLGYREGATFSPDYLGYTGGKYDLLGFDDGTRKLPSIVPGYGDFRKANISQKEYANNFSNILHYGKKTALPPMQITANYYNTFKVADRYLSTLTSLSYRSDTRHSLADRTSGNWTDWERIEDEGFGETLLSERSRSIQNSENNQISLLQNFTYKLNQSTSLHFKNFLLQQGESGTVQRTSAPNQYFNADSEQWKILDPIRNFPQRDITLSYSQRFLYSGNLGGQTKWKEEKHAVDYNLGYTLSKLNLPDQRVIRLQNAVTSVPDRMDLAGEYEQQWVSRWRLDDIDAQNNRNQMGMISRTWMRNKEQVYNGSLDYTWKTADWVTFKAGTYQQFKQRNVFRRTYTVNEGDVPASGIAPVPGAIGGNSSFMDFNLVFFKQQDLPYVWSEEYLRDDGSGLKVFDRTSASDAYKATEQNNSGYMAASLLPFAGKLDIYGGVRVEYNRQKVAGAVPGINSGSPNVPVFADLKGTEILPSVNIGYRPSEAFVFRAAYGKTVNRPETRELSPYSELDYQNNQNIQGNPNLQIARMDNIDLRAEWYPNNNESGEMLSIGGFYKTLDKPIERTIYKELYFSGDPVRISYNNAGKGKVYGLEIDLRKNLDFLPVDFLRNFYILANGAYFYSKVIVDPNTLGYEPGQIGYRMAFFTPRQLQGQSPYSYNTGLYYENAGWGSRLGLTYNEVGPRLYAVSTGERSTSFDVANRTYPGDQASIIELTRRQLDFSYTQRIGTGMQLKFSAQNLLNNSIQMAEDANFSYKYEKARLLLPEGGASGTPGLFTGIYSGYDGDLLSLDYKPGRAFFINFTYSF